MLKAASESEEKQDILERLDEIVSWNHGAWSHLLISSGIIQMAELLLHKNERVRLAALKVIDSFVKTWTEEV